LSTTRGVTADDRGDPVDPHGYDLSADVAPGRPAVIVFGHVLGVVAAHDRAIALFRGRDTLRAQYLLVTTMVFYTLSGIALLVGT
jgi:hypothetical protein